LQPTIGLSPRAKLINLCNAMSTERTARERYTLRTPDGTKSGLTAAEVEALFRSGLINRKTQIAQSGQDRWLTIDDLFPLLKYGETTAAQSSEPLRGTSVPQSRPRSASSALLAGVICMLIGAGTAWFFPPSFVFLFVSAICSIVAMCSHQVSAGITLLVSSLLMMAVCAATLLKSAAHELSKSTPAL
jgi:hypothetical protein